MNSIWNKNIQAFKGRFPQLAEIHKDTIKALESALSKGDTPPFWQTKTAKTGDITATENGIALHSSYNPVREAQQAVMQKEVEEKSTTVFFGFGLGYHLIEWAKLYKNTSKKLVIIEPDIAHFFASLSILDWTEVFKIEQLVIAVACPAENILGLIEDQSKINIGNTGVSDAYFFKIPAFISHSENYFSAVKTIIDRNIEKNKINEATLKKFGKLWCRNSITNLKQLSLCPQISDFKDKCKLPFLVIGAGPSLETILPYIHEIKKRTVIICVETALHTLLRNNIQPDFIILMDPQYWAYKHIAALEAPESILITEITAFPATFRFNCKKIMLSASQFPVGKYFEQKLNLNSGDLGTGGSVASSAFNFAVYCGAKEIYFAGLDLGFPQKQTHIRGSSAEQTFHKIASKIKTSEKLGIGSLFSANAQKGIDYMGTPVLTDSRMKMFAWWFESRIAGLSDVCVKTLCPQSLKIPGIDIASINDILQLPEVSESKVEFLKTGKAPSVQNLEPLIKNFPDKEFISEYPFLEKYL